MGGAARQPPTEAVDHLVELTAQVRGPGKAVDRGMGQSPAVSIPVTVEAVGRGTTVISVDLPTRLFVDGADLSTPLPVGSVIRCHGRFSPRPPTSTEPTARAVTPPTVVAPPGALAALGDRIRDGLVQATGPDPPTPPPWCPGSPSGTNPVRPRPSRRRCERRDCPI
ncbi:MAG: hypothetical protein U0R64_03725 [Candidatus Nanopelagicales bacterium]